MAMKCTICNHPEREAIDKALVSDKSIRSIAAQYNVALTSLRRHKENHLPGHLAKAKAAEEVTQADNLLDDLQYLKGKAISLLEQAEKESNLSAAAQLIGQARQVVETLAEVRGELNRQTQINIIQAPIWVETRTMILKALGPYPEARQAVTLALEDKCKR